MRKEHLSGRADCLAGNILCINPSCFIHFHVVTFSELFTLETHPLLKQETRQFSPSREGKANISAVVQF